MDAPKATRCTVCKSLTAYPHCSHCGWWMCRNRGCGSFGDATRTVNRKDKEKK